MIRFAHLFAAIDQTNSTIAKVDAMAEYFASAPPADAAWAVFFLTGRRLKRLVPGAAIREWTVAATGLDGWMLEECYAVVGDGAETAALVLDQLPPGQHDQPLSLAAWVEERILPLRTLERDDQEALVIAWVCDLDRWQRLVLFKLLTGEFRLGVSQTLVVRALAQTASLPTATIAARLMGDWTPTASWFEALLTAGRTEDDLSRPYPFFLASPLEQAGLGHSGGRDRGREFSAASSAERLAAAEGHPADHLGDLTSWSFEWKWDGIRAQLVKRAGLIHLWSRGEELITERFPEIVDGAALLPDGTVLDGEILAFRNDRPLPFSALQQRIGRQKQVARKARDVPVVFMSYDILEHAGLDIRAKSWSERRQTLEDLLTRDSRPEGRTEGGTEGRTEGGTEGGTSVPPSRAAKATPSTPPGGAMPLLPFDDVGPGLSPAVLRLSPLVDISSWDDLARLRHESRAYGVEGLMLKRRASQYGVGRKRGDWWKWKIDPFTIDAVLIYAQPGSGKRASLLTDYTFGVWDNGELVPIAKAYSGLTNEEIAEMDRWIRRHTIERFGPVRHVEPIHVFELGFEAIARSSRHRSGVAVRFPRMLRWRKDKSAAEADTLETLRQMIGS